MPASFQRPVYLNIAAGALRIADVENLALAERGQWHRRCKRFIEINGGR
jgi:hypothetical protein